MENSIIIIGGKPINVDLKEIIYLFKNVCRVNCNLSFKSPNNKDTFYVNNHVYKFFIKEKLSPIELKKIYHFVDFDIITNFYNMLSNNEYKEIEEQYESGKSNLSNAFLKQIKCPYLFLKAPRCGYQAILKYIQIGIKPFICGFSFKDEYNITNGVNKHVSDCHDTKSELNILHWLHNNNYIDATLCMLEDHELPLLDCQNLNINPAILFSLIKQFGICILRNYYDKDSIEKFDKEFERVFLENKDKIDILDKEYCSCDERIFWTEKYSEYIKNNFSDNNLFNFIAEKYRNGYLRSNKKTLINLLEYEEGKIRNSGAGWHRDNHNCQFKAIMYLSDVTTKNGPFTWITNSSKKHIGYPKPRTEDYNTRYHNSTIEDLLNNNNNCNEIEVCGNKGDIILVDTTYIHRGKIIEQGTRKAITQYYF